MGSMTKTFRESCFSESRIINEKAVDITISVETTDKDCQDLQKLDNQSS